MTYDEAARDGMAHMVAFLVYHSLAVDGITADAVDTSRLKTQCEVDEVVDAVLAEWAARGFGRCDGPIEVADRFNVRCKSGLRGKCYDEGFGVIKKAALAALAAKHQQTEAAP